MKYPLTALFLGLMLALSGCGKQEPTKPEPNQPSQESSHETKTLAAGEGEGGARVEFVTRSHSMDRIAFSGGYLHSLPEETPSNIVRPAPAGAQGMIFGTRELGGLEWAKVATRDGVTAWYAVPTKEGASQEEKRASLQIANAVYKSTYPQITGGVSPDIQDRINQELGSYFSVYRHVTGPVGGELSCQITYNRRGILSLVFTAKPILFRNYPVSEVNNLTSWIQLKKYACITPLMGGADPSLLTAEKTDLQYAMTFDLRTGRRLTWDYFLGKEATKEVERRVTALGHSARLQTDIFYVNDKGQLVALADLETGRVPLDLSDLVSRDY